MADRHHLDRLKEGVDVWNQWRKEHPELPPDLRKAHLEGMSLAGVNFQRTCLDGATFQSVLLDQAKLCHAHLNGACFKGKSQSGRERSLHNRVGMAGRATGHPYSHSRKTERQSRLYPCCWLGGGTGLMS